MNRHQRVWRPLSWSFRRRKLIGQPARLELAPRRWQRRALPVELCLPCLCHIPSCKRTLRLFRSHCRSGSEAHPLPTKIWYPTRDSNPELHVSETCAYADSASGANKKPGDLAVRPGLWRVQTKYRRYLSPSVPVARARARPNARDSASCAMPFGSRPIRGCNVV